MPQNLKIAHFQEEVLHPLHVNPGTFRQKLNEVLLQEAEGRNKWSEYLGLKLESPAEASLLVTTNIRYSKILSTL